MVKLKFKSIITQINICLRIFVHLFCPYISSLSPGSGRSQYVRGLFSGWQYSPVPVRWIPNCQGAQGDPP